MSSYTEKDIVHLKDLEAVRKRPGMYVGDITSEAGIFQVIKEVVDNALDEHLAGHCKNIDIILNLRKNVVTVVDDGRGIPQKSLKLVFSKLHAGSKFGGKIYSVSSGAHGVGISSTNALSEFLECYSIRKGKPVWIRFKKGKLVGGPKVKKERDVFTSKRSGTVVIFKPDFSILKYRMIPAKRILKWLASIPNLCPKLKINCKIYLPSGKEFFKTFFSKKGMKGKAKRGDFYCKTKSVEVWVKFLSEKSKLSCYVNTIPISEGSHIKGFWKALKTSISTYAKGKAPKVNCLREGVEGILHALVRDPVFVGQTKERLGDNKVERLLYEELKTQFGIFFRKNPSLARRIIKQARAIENLDKERKEKLAAIKGLEKDVKKGKLPTSLAVSTTKDPEERELFICEGESAAGTLKAARDRVFQEVLPLKGKILNVARAKEKRVLSNKEIKNIIISIGSSLPEDGRVGKVIFIADSDPDGSHITSLLITLFSRLLPKWIKEEKVFVVKAPLFHMIHKGKRYFGNTAKEVLSKVKGKGIVMRVKGWGEMKPNDLKYIALGPQTREFYKLEMNGRSLKKLNKIMGSDTTARKKLLGIS